MVANLNILVTPRSLDNAVATEGTRSGGFLETRQCFCEESNDDGPTSNEPRNMDRRRGFSFRRTY